MTLLLALVCLAGPAVAQDDDDLDVDPTTGLPDVRSLDLGDDDDVDIAMPPAPEPEKPGLPVFAPDAGTAEPLSAFPATIAAVGAHVVVVEAPVLVARARKPGETGLLVIGEFLVGDAKVVEVRQVLEPAAILEAAPTWAVLRAVVPAATPTGTVTIVVRTAGRDGKNPQEAYRTTADWTLPAAP